MQKIAVLGVPSSAGARRVGQERAPRSFRSKGLVERLRSAQLEVMDLGDLPEIASRPDPQNPKRQNLNLVRDVARQVAEQVSRATQLHAKPLVLGGDCTITLGVIAGLIRHLPDLGLMYVDGDVDLHTPADTTSGIFDGMGMAHIIGMGADELSRLGPRYPLLPQENIVLFGYNLDSGWVDDIEIERLQQCSMIRYPAGHIRGTAAEASREALERLEDRATHILVHFDVDVIDDVGFPVADVPHQHGLSFSQAMQALRVFLCTPKFAGLVVTEFNDARDPDGTYAEQLVTAITERLTEGYPHWKES